MVHTSNSFWSCILVNWTCPSSLTDEWQYSTFTTFIFLLVGKLIHLVKLVFQIIKCNIDIDPEQMGKSHLVVVNYNKVRIHCDWVWIRKVHCILNENYKLIKNIILYKSMCILFHKNYWCNLYHTIESNEWTCFRLENLNHAKTHSALVEIIESKYKLYLS